MEWIGLDLCVYVFTDKEENEVSVSVTGSRRPWHVSYARQIGVRLGVGPLSVCTLVVAVPDLVLHSF